MNAKTTIFGVLTAVALAFTPFAATAGEQPPPTAEMKAFWYDEEHIVDFAYMSEYAVLPKREDVTIVDSRPANKFGPGHIPTAIALPDSKFAELAPTMLPEDKDQLLIFYCGGYHCKLSHNSARSAAEMGYTNVKVYAAGMPDWKFQGGRPAIDTVYLQQLMAAPEPVMVIDSRPANKIGGGVIPGAINIPDSQFDALAGLLPADKDIPLVFYCGGFICKLSDKSAVKAMALGYTNVSTYPPGFPAWKKEVAVVAMNVAPDGEAATIAAVPEMAAPGEGTIPIDEFKAILAEMPDDVMIVDVRDTDEYARGAIPGTTNIPVGDLEDQLFDLPDDKRIVFVCTSGGRSGEAYDLVKLLREDLNVAYVDAVMQFSADGSVEITAH